MLAAMLVSTGVYDMVFSTVNVICSSFSCNGLRMFP